MEKLHIIWDNADSIASGTANTLIFFVLCSIISFVIGCFIAFFLDGRGGIAQTVVRGFIDVLRTLPFLVILYLVYYGLPDFGIRLSAWTCGFLALCIYHGAYFAEILRGARSSLPAGQAEAALAHGYTRVSAYRRILLPQMVFKSAPLFGNQLIICLKDTAFLSIITIFELTAAANNIQAMYFAPIEAFITVIAIYWMITLCVEYLIKKLNDRGKSKGLSNA
jgi:polar amino acid transport system permease protein